MNSLDEAIRTARNMVAHYQARIDWLQKHRAELEATGVDKVSTVGSGIDFDYLTRDEALKVIKAFPGNWTKSPNFTDASKIDYKTECDGIELRLYETEPPPTCELVEEEVVIPAVPARIEKRLRLVCKEVEL